MSTAIDTVWEKVKDAAARYAERGLIPTKREAEGLVSSFIRQARCDPHPPAQAIDFFAAELIAQAYEHAGERIAEDETKKGSMRPAKGT